MRKEVWIPMVTAVVVVTGMIWLFPQWRSPSPSRIEPEPAPLASLRQARYWRELDRNRVACYLCPQNCLIPEGRRGWCGVRENREGVLFSLVYGRPVAMGVSPIEKAPFDHFHPGHLRQTIATVGCNLQCKNCQNWQISQGGVDEVQYRLLQPHDVIAGVQRAGLNSVSFTYTEPTVFFEYMYDIAELAQRQGIKTTLVTNGFINPEPLRAILQHMDAVRVDLKAFNEEFYREITGASLAPVLNTLKIIQDEGVWLEIINLIIPTYNDCPDEIREMCEWILENLGPDVPLHFNRFHPAFKMTHLPPTPVETLEMAHGIARDVGVHFVTIGNVPGHRYDSTYCPNCDEKLIHRVGFSILANNIENGECKFCGKEIPGVWG